MSHALPKSVDSKGRLTLGEKFANRVVLVRDISETEVLVELATVVPDRELWLHNNKAAMASVQRGLSEARQGKFAAKAPDIAKGRKLARKLKD
jgi:hypothetical protein